SKKRPLRTPPTPPASPAATSPPTTAATAKTATPNPSSANSSTNSLPSAKAAPSIAASLLALSGFSEGPAPSGFAKGARRSLPAAGRDLACLSLRPRRLCGKTSSAPRGLPFNDQLSAGDSAFPRASAQMAHCYLFLDNSSINQHPSLSSLPCTNTVPRLCWPAAPPHSLLAPLFTPRIFSVLTR